MNSNSKYKGPVLEYFHHSRVELQKEVANHPQLIEQLAAFSHKDFGGKIGTVAAYCNIAMDGVYSQHDIDKLCGILIDKLKKKRTIIIH